MKYVLLLIMFFSLSACGPSAKVKAERLEKGKQLCCSQGGLWYISGDMAHCNNGANFHQLDLIIVVDKTCYMNITLDSEKN